MSKNKNISKSIPNGRTFQTKDNFFFGANNYRKPNTKGKGYYRKVVVIDSNRRNELAVVKLTTSNKGIPINTYKQGKSKFKPFVETKDFRNKPIKKNRYFIQNSKKDDLNKHQIAEIKKIVFNYSKNSYANKHKVRKLKNR